MWRMRFNAMAFKVRLLRLVFEMGATMFAYDGSRTTRERHAHPWLKMPLHFQIEISLHRLFSARITHRQIFNPLGFTFST